MPFGPAWISAEDAAASISRRFHGRSRAQQSIAIALRENLLEARAKWFGTAGGGRVDEASGDEGLKIPSEIWTRSLHWEEDVASWDWANGQFRVDVEPWPGDLHVFGGVHFLRDEIELLSPDARIFAGLSSVKVISHAQRAPAARVWNWEEAFADLVVIASVDGLEGEFGELTQRGNQAKLERWFADWFSKKSLRDEPGADREAPSPNECRIRARMVVGRLRSRQSGP